MTVENDGDSKVTLEIEQASPYVDVTIPDETGDSNKESKGKSTNEPPPGHPRWTDVYRDMSDAKRDAKKSKEEAAEYKKKLDSSDGLMNMMKDHNKNLSDAISKVDTMSDEMSKTKEDTEKEKAVTLYNDLTKAKTTAMEKGEFSNVSTIDEQLMDLKIQINQFDKARKDKKDTPAPTKSAGPVQQPEIVAEAKRFAADTEWFGKDEMMTGAAMAIEKTLMRDSSFTGDYPELLEEVKKRVEERFKFETKSSSTNINSVESSSNVSGGRKGGSVKMSQEELRIAGKMGISPQDWARQKLIIERSKGGK